MSTSPSTLENTRIDVRLRISALWIAMLFLFAYGDIFGMFQPGRIDEIRSGTIASLHISQAFLLAVSVYIAIASVMVFLTLTLPPRANRWTNIVLAILHIVSIVASVIGEDWVYFWFLSLVECALLLLVVWNAWRWPTRMNATVT
jgi:uncharacterized protein DUF6326